MVLTVYHPLTRILHRQREDFLTIRACLLALIPTLSHMHVEGASSSGYPSLSPLVRSALASLGLSHTLYLRLEETEMPSEYMFGKN